MKSNFIVKIQLDIIRVSIDGLNLVLRLLERMLFRPLIAPPQRILIFKVGNIGDIVCAIPALIAIRRTYPGAHLTLLTSPGRKGVPGADAVLTGAWYLDELRLYASDNINSVKKLRMFARSLRQERYDLFIHLPPHEWTNFGTIARNMFFARLIGVRAAFGFRLRALIWLFRKTQIDYTIGPHEVDTLLALLRTGGVKTEQVTFDLPLTAADRAKAEQLLNQTWPDETNSPVVAVHAGSKQRFKEWRPERFAAVLAYLAKRYQARFLLLGGPADAEEASVITKNLPPNQFVIVAGQLSVLESAALIERCDFLLGIDSGLMHIAAAFGKPTVALFSIFNVFGRWFPYGQQHEIIFHRFLRCDYRQLDCVRQSMEAITVDEVTAACDRVIGRLRQ